MIITWHYPWMLLSLVVIITLWRQTSQETRLCKLEKDRES